MRLLNPNRKNPKMVIVIDTRNTGASSTSSNQYALPIHGSNLNLQVDWGDGNVEMVTEPNKVHTYSTEGVYQISILRNGNRSFNHNTGTFRDRDKLLEIKSWGKDTIDYIFRGFFQCINMVITAEDTFEKLIRPNTSMREWFSGCSSLTTIPNMESWDMTGMTNLRAAFSGCDLQVDLSNWDIRNVTNTEFLFNQNANLNFDLNTWNVSSATLMSGMFQSCSSFNGRVDGNFALTKSNNSSITSFFSGCTSFNQDVSSWDVSQTTSLASVFRSATSFNQDLSAWDVSNVQSFSSTFRDAIVFNQDLSSWDVSSVVNMSSMFLDCSAFNNGGSNGIRNWNTGNLENCFQMFLRANSFNQPLNDWDVSNVTNFGRMFEEASSFNQSLSKWNTSSLIAISEMFEAASSFDQPVGNFDISKVTSLNRTFLSSGYSHPIGGYNITTTISSNLINLTSHGFSTGDVVRFKGLSNTTGIIDGITYYVSETNNTANSFRVTTDSSGLSVGDIVFGGTDDTINLYLNQWDTSSVQLFTATGISNLSNFDKLDVSSVNNFSNLLDSRTDVNSLDLSAWTPKTTDTIIWTFFNRNGNLDFNISVWDASAFINLNESFEGLSTTNYDLLLEEWSKDNLQLNQTLGVSAPYTETQVDLGTTDGTAANKLIESGQDFLTTVSIGDIIHNTTDNTFAEVTAIDSDTQLSLDNDIMVSGENYVVQSSNAAKGRYILINTYNWTINDGGAV